MVNSVQPAWDASLRRSVNVSGISRGKPAPLRAIIGFARVEEALDSFATKDIIHPTQSFLLLIILISLASSLEATANNRPAHYGKHVWKAVALKSSAVRRKT